MNILCLYNSAITNSLTAIIEVANNYPTDNITFKDLKGISTANITTYIGTLSANAYHKVIAPVYLGGSTLDVPVVSYDVSGSSINLPGDVSQSLLALGTLVVANSTKTFDVIAISKNNKTVTISGDVSSLKAGDKFALSGTTGGTDDNAAAIIDTGGATYNPISETTIIHITVSPANDDTTGLVTLDNDATYTISTSTYDKSINQTVIVTTVAPKNHYVSGDVSYTYIEDNGDLTSTQVTSLNAKLYTDLTKGGDSVSIVPVPTLTKSFAKLLWDLLNPDKSRPYPLLVNLVEAQIVPNGLIYGLRTIFSDMTTYPIQQMASRLIDVYNINKAPLSPSAIVPIYEIYTGHSTLPANAYSVCTQSTLTYLKYHIYYNTGTNVLEVPMKNVMLLSKWDMKAGGGSAILSKNGVYSYDSTNDSLDLLYSYNNIGATNPDMVLLNSVITVGNNVISAISNGVVSIA